MLFGLPLDVWAAQLFIGLVNGCILILVAQGLSIVFGLMGIINFAHGIFYMLGAYAGWVTVRAPGASGWPWCRARSWSAWWASSSSAGSSGASTGPATRTSPACS